MWLVNTEDSVDAVERFLEGGSVGLPNLFDTTGAWYRSYDRRSVEGSYAPYPLQVLIDPEGRIRHIAGQYDPVAMKARIDGLLAE